MAYFGVTGYDDIRSAVAQALQSEEVKTIMLHVSSGGGQVNGVEDLGSFLKAAGRIKPLTTYADGTMASAAYWLGSYGSHISTNRTSMLGSLGVVLVLPNYSKAAEAAGIKYEIIRAGKYKQLGHPMEPFSDEARAEYQGQADGIYSVFMDVIGPNRKMTAAVADETIGQGRVFLGKQAVKNGLADAIMSYEQAVMFSKSLDKLSQTNNNPAKSKGASAMSKPQLTAEHLAAIASGASLEDLGLPAATATIDPAVVDAAATVVVSGLALAAPAVVVPAVAVPSVEPSAELTAALAQNTLLATQLATAVAAKDTAVAEATAVKSQLDSLSAVNAQMTDIARKATANMLIPFGGSADSVAQMSGADLVAKHAEVSAMFTTKLRAGGITQAASAPAAPAVDSWQRAMVGAGPQARKAALLNR
jgi:signal peptide peptidase SppA